MGWIKHNAIVVTGGDFGEHMLRAHDKAREIFGGMVSEIVASTTNGYLSFLIAPDGSKEGWTSSDEGDERRQQFKEWLRSVHGGYYQWVEVEYAETPPEVVDADNFGDPS